MNHRDHCERVVGVAVLSCSCLSVLSNVMQCNAVCNCSGLKVQFKLEIRLQSWMVPITISKSENESIYGIKTSPVNLARLRFALGTFGRSQRYWCCCRLAA